MYVFWFLFYCFYFLNNIWWLDVFVLVVFCVLAIFLKTGFRCRVLGGGGWGGGWGGWGFGFVVVFVF